MKTLCKRSLAFAMLLAILFTLTAPSAFAVSTNYNASLSPVTCNASDGSLPSGISTVNTGTKIYFNIQVDSSQKLKTVALWLKAPGDNNYKQAASKTAKNYLRYQDFPYQVGSKTGTLSYYFVLTHTNGSRKTLSTKSLTVAQKPVVIVSESEIKSAASTYGIGLGTNAYKALQAINNYNSKLTDAQKKGTLVFLFEGVGNNASASARMNAMCVVVKSGKIKYVNRNSSTVPDYPFDPSKNEGTPMPTLKSGVRSFTTVNHRNSYAALNVTSAPVVRFRSKSSYYSDTSYAINVHRRSTNTIAPKDATWVNSAGCQLVGKAGTDKNSEYAKFIQAVGIVKSGTGGNVKYQTYVTGKIIIDRSYAKQYLRNVGYSEAAIKLIG